MYFSVKKKSSQMTLTAVWLIAVFQEQNLSKTLLDVINGDINGGINLIAILECVCSVCVAQ